jgi:hypothetical protein
LLHLFLSPFNCGTNTYDVGYILLLLLVGAQFPIEARGNLIEIFFFKLINYVVVLKLASDEKMVLV